MKKAETTNLVELLNGFYKIDTARIRAITIAWHEAFKEHEYEEVAAAITSFAVKDVREYPTMPGVGQIMAELEANRKKKVAPINRVYNAALDYEPYDNLPENVQTKISSGVYEKYREMDPDVLRAKEAEIKARIQKDMEATQWNKLKSG